eukprot:COSAG01_NODE_1011_length_12147_cov_12.737384_4_plen_74_part_00
MPGDTTALVRTRSAEERAARVRAERAAAAAQRESAQLDAETAALGQQIRGLRLHLQTQRHKLHRELDREGTGI